MVSSHPDPGPISKLQLLTPSRSVFWVGHFLTMAVRLPRAGDGGDDCCDKVCFENLSVIIREDWGGRNSPRVFLKWLRVQHMSNFADHEGLQQQTDHFYFSRSVASETHVAPFHDTTHADSHLTTGDTGHPRAKKTANRHAGIQQADAPTRQKNETQHGLTRKAALQGRMRLRRK